MKEKVLFLSGLNGIRAIAAFGVLISHIHFALKGFNIEKFSLLGFDAKGAPQGWVLGEHGVTMFFVLSGFLITYLLLKEFDKNQDIKIKAFYMRRILRIWPLYFLFLFAVVVVYFFLDLNFDYKLIYYILFTANIPFVNQEAFAGMDHLWSIAVEEQFYLFWPFLFIFLLKKRFITYLVGIIVILSLFRIGLWYFMPFSKIALYSVVNRFDCMFFGALGAFMLFKNNRIIDLLNSKFNQLLVWGILFLMVINNFWFLNSIIEIFVVEYVTLSIIIGQIKKKNRIVNLEIQPFIYLGKISFGIYVYHPLIILVFSHFCKYQNQFNETYYGLFILLLIVTCTILISHISYYYFETKFLKMKHKFSIIKSSNENIIRNV